MSRQGKGLSDAETPRGELVVSACPPWCIGQHQQAWDEGCDQEGAAEHTAYDIGEPLSELTNHYSGDVLREGGGHYRLRLFAPTVPPRAGTFPVTGMPLISLEVAFGRVAGRRDTRATVKLTTSEARSMAARLLALADVEELS